MDYKKKTPIAVMVSFAVTVLLTGGAIVSGAYANPLPAAQDLNRGVSGSSGMIQESGILDAVEKIKMSRTAEGMGYSYIQAAWYQEPCIFQVGWNLPESDRKFYESTKLTLPDGTEMEVFYDASCKDDIRDDAVKKALASLLGRLQTEVETDGELPLKQPFVVDIQRMENNSIEALTEKFYQEGKVAQFSALFSTLDENMQRQYLDRAFKDGETGFFASCLDKMRPNAQVIDDYAEKAYQAGEISFFAIVCDEMDEEARQKWIVRAALEDRTSYLAVLTD